MTTAADKRIPIPVSLGAFAFLTKRLESLTHAKFLPLRERSAE